MQGVVAPAAAAGGGGDEGKESSPLCVTLGEDSWASPPSFSEDNLSMFTSTPRDSHMNRLDESSVLAADPPDAILMDDKETTNTTGARRKLYADNKSATRKTKRKSSKRNKKQSTPRKDKRMDGSSLSDFEEGDTEEFTKARRARKEKRYAERLVERAPPVPLYLRDGNTEFVHDFNDALNKQKGLKYHKYTTTLFRDPESSWLGFVTEHKWKQDFLLSDLVNWDDASRRKQPGEIDAWLDSVPETPQKGTKR